MSNLLTIRYWFDLQPEPLLATAWQSLIGGIALLFILTIVLAFIKMRPSIYRGFWKRAYAFTLTNTLIGLLILFFNYESVPFFSARFWLGLWGIIMLAWLIFILRDLRAIPGKRKELAQQQEKNKYLPR